jgi:outer membrane receptor protein involved in Fe transport
VVKKVNSSYDITSDMKIYATYAQGFRRGGANALPTSGAFASLPQYQTYAPDLANDYELGIKGTFSNRLNYSADIYRIYWDRFQFDGLTFAGIPATYNGTKARSQGAEIETEYALTKNTKVRLGYAYTDAIVTNSFDLVDYLSYATVPAFGGTGQTASLFGKPVSSGSPLPGVSKNVVTAGIDEVVPVAGMPLTLHIDGVFRSAQSAYIAEASPYNWTIPSNFIGNGRITFSPNSPLEYSAFIYNFTDNPGYSGGQYVQNVVNYARYRNVTRPRTYGIDLRYKF